MELMFTQNDTGSIVQTSRWLFFCIDPSLRYGLLTLSVLAAGGDRLTL